eukprot:COSAG02_NODE_3783_length_6235_cov_20.382823_4_plen_56_part_00
MGMCALTQQLTQQVFVYSSPVHAAALLYPRPLVRSPEVATSYMHCQCNWKCLGWS